MEARQQKYPIEKLKELVDRYIAVWNEPDAQRRRDAIAALWTEDGAQLTRSFEVRGHAALETRIATAYEKWVGSGRFVFRSANDVDGHNDVVRFHWQMVTPSGEVDSVGFDFFILADDGRIRIDYQFVEPPPAR